tara:strand:- start:246 stop:485 length:240 start_codon:yes stop_codon:yes gene_type:complete
MKIEEVTLERAKELNLHGLEEVEPDYKAIYVVETSNKYQAKPWFYQANDGYYCTCEIAGISEDTEDKQEAIDFILRAVS